VVGTDFTVVAGVAGAAEAAGSIAAEMGRVSSDFSVGRFSELFFSEGEGEKTFFFQ